MLDIYYKYIVNVIFIRRQLPSDANHFSRSVN
jgi:hypothetical protein